MNRYKVTAEPIKGPMYFHGNSEDEAWEKAKKLAGRNATKLYNGKVEKVPTEAELEAENAAKDARIAELEAVAKLALRYLEHPDVLEITRAMALSGDAVVERLRSALEPQ